MNKMGLDDYLLDHSVEEFEELTERELTGDDLNKEEEGDKKKKSQSEVVLELASKHLILFHDKNKEPFCFLDNEAVPLRSKKIRNWLAMLYYQTTGKGLNSDSLGQVLNVLEAVAVFQSPEIELWNRIAKYDGAFWYDLGNGKVVKVAAGGWEIIASPILFRRYTHQQAQVKPVPGGDPWRIFKFLNVPQSNRLLVLVYIISCFVPDYPHPIFYPHGAQGSGKTCLCNLIKKLIDPSSVEAIISPRDVSQLIQMVAHHHICLFDNISALPGWMSDILAQACTGGGFSKRQLYTDDDDIIYQVKRCIGLNGINLLISKPDLMDRAILLTLERIEPSRRIEEVILWQKFDEEKPHILGGIFDTLAKTMVLYPNVKPSYLHRMADFTRWGVAIAEALGDLGEDFLRAYTGNIEAQSEEVVQGNTLAQAVLTFMNDKTEWNGFIKDIFTVLSEIANPPKYDKTFPGDHKNLRRHLERIKTTLLEFGIKFTTGKRSNQGIPIRFQQGCKSSTPTTLTTQLEDNLLKFKPEFESVDDVNMEKSSTPTTQSSTLVPAESVDNVDEKIIYTSSTPNKSLKSFKNVDGVDSVDDLHTSWGRGKVRPDEQLALPWGEVACTGRKGKPKEEGEVIDLTNMEVELLP